MSLMSSDWDLWAEQGHMIGSPAKALYYGELEMVSDQ